MDGPLSVRANFELMGCDLIEEDQRHDLALLRIRTNPFTSGRTPGVSMTPDGGTVINAMWGLATLNLSRTRDGDGIVCPATPCRTRP